MATTLGGGGDDYIGHPPWSNIGGDISPPQDLRLCNPLLEDFNTIWFVFQYTWPNLESQLTIKSY